MKATIGYLSGMLLIFMMISCTKHEVEMKPVEIKPIHITIDVNVKVDRALDDFFGDIDAASEPATDSGSK